MKRWPLFAAIAYVVLLFAGLFVVPAAPEVSASGVRLVRYFQDHGNGVRTVTWLSAWSMVPLVLLVASLRSRLAGAVFAGVVMGHPACRRAPRRRPTRALHHDRERPIDGGLWADETRIGLEGATCLGWGHPRSSRLSRSSWCVCMFGARCRSRLVGRVHRSRYMGGEER